MLDPALHHAFVAHAARMTEVHVHAHDRKAHAALRHAFVTVAQNVPPEVLHQVVEDREVMRVIDDPRGIAVTEADAKGLNVFLRHYRPTVRERSTARTGLASAPERRSGRAISS